MTTTNKSLQRQMVFFHPDVIPGIDPSIVSGSLFDRSQRESPRVQFAPLRPTGRMKRPTSGAADSTTVETHFNELPGLVSDGHFARSRGRDEFSAGWLAFLGYGRPGNLSKPPPTKAETAPYRGAPFSRRRTVNHGMRTVRTPHHVQESRQFRETNVKNPFNLLSTIQGITIWMRLSTLLEIHRGEGQRLQMLTEQTRRRAMNTGKKHPVQFGAVSNCLQIEHREAIHSP
jgi:hypothetical protein